MKKTKSTLYTMIGLLVILLPLTIIGTYRHIANRKVDEIVDNPNHEFYYQGRLYFYNDALELLGTYNCQSDDCGHIITNITDNNYNLDYYEGDKEYLDFQNDNFVFIKDGYYNYLYNIKTSSVLVSYEELKDYHTDLENNLLIAKQGGKWGVISLDTMTNVLPFKYSFIGLPNKVKGGVLETKNFIIYTDNRWYIFDNEGTALSQGLLDPIKNFTSKYILTTTNKIYDYKEALIPFDTSYKQMDIIDDYFVVLLPNNVLTVYSDIAAGTVAGRAVIGEFSEIKYEILDNNLIVYGDGTMATSIALS